MEMAEAVVGSSQRLHWGMERMGTWMMRERRTQQHVGLFALAHLEARLRQKHKRLQGLYRGLIYIDLLARTTRISVAISNSSIIAAKLGRISGNGVSMHWRCRAGKWDEAYRALTA